MSTTGKIYLGDILVSDPSSGGGSSVEYVTFTFSGGNTFKFCGLTDHGYLDDYTINGSGTLNVVKDSICIIGKMVTSLSHSITPSNYSVPHITQQGVSHPVYAGKFPHNSFDSGSAASWDSYDYMRLTTVIADQDITFYADED